MLQLFLFLFVLIPGGIGLVGGKLSAPWTSGFCHRFVMTCVAAVVGGCAVLIVAVTLLWDDSAFVQESLWGAVQAEVMISVCIGALGFMFGRFSSGFPGDSTRCQHCGYSLRGLTGNPIRCPECGEDQQTESEL